MILQTLATALLALQPAPSLNDLVAIRVGRAETIANGGIDNAVILIEDGKIIAVGEDLEIARGIRIIDRPDWVATPGLVNCHSRAGMDSKAGRSFEPHRMASDELYARQDVWAELLDAGVTTIGLYPPGTGISGRAVAVRPHGATTDEMILADSVYLKVHLISSAASKKMLRDGFKKVDDYDEKVAKARAKWEKAEEKKKKKSKSKSKSKKDDDKEEDDKKKDEKAAEPTPFVKPKPDAKVVPFIELRKKELTAFMSIRKASDYLHLIDVIDDEEIDWSLHVPLRDDIDLYEVCERIGDDERRIVLTSLITLQPSTRRERNLPAEFDRAGARVVLLPTSDSTAATESWIHDVGHLVTLGLDREAALAAITLEAAHVLGLADRIGSLEAGKDANIVLWDGDPFEPQTRVRSVMLDGEFVSGEEIQ